MTDIVSRETPPLRGDEAATLMGFLDYQRSTLRLKTAGLDAEQLATTIPTSAITLGGLLRHLSRVESVWTNDVVAGDPPVEPWLLVDWAAEPDWDWTSAGRASPEQLRAEHDAAVSASRAVLAEAIASAGPDHLSAVESSRPGAGPFSLRYVLLRMIEEYARHNGHADLLREAVDGSTGV
jgi:hypothetical protein